MHDWPQQLRRMLADHDRCVAVTVANVRGSAPREVGSKMLVSVTQNHGTIGGGYLENACIQRARDTLDPASDAPRRQRRRFALGSQCGQCCGGVVDVLFETLTKRDHPWLDALVHAQQQHTPALLISSQESGNEIDKIIMTGSDITGYGDRLSATASAVLHWQAELGQSAAARSAHLPGKDHGKHAVLLETVGAPPLRIVIFGAGHVGHACTAVFGTLDAAVTIVDSRADYLDQRWPDNATPVLAQAPAEFVAHCAANTHYLIMTHDHAIDLELCAHILRRTDRASCGLIGSRSKRRRFEKRLRATGLSSDTLATLTCPIGLDRISGKAPGEIAIATAAQLLTRRDCSTQHATLRDIKTPPPQALSR